MRVCASCQLGKHIINSVVENQVSEGNLTLCLSSPPHSLFVHPNPSFSFHCLVCVCTLHVGLSAPQNIILNGKIVVYVCAALFVLKRQHGLGSIEAKGGIC